MSESTGSLLTRVCEIRSRYGPGLAEEKTRLVTLLARRRLGSSREVESFHDAVLFMRAFPDDAGVLDACEQALRGFHRRGDVVGAQRDLEGTGIAGTTMSYPFSDPMARWLAAREPEGARLVWPDWERSGELDELLPLLTRKAEAPGVDDEAVSAREWLRNARCEGKGDYATLVERFAALDAAPEAREYLFNKLDVPVQWNLGGGPDSRTLARWQGDLPQYQRGPLEHGRPKLRQAVRQVPRIRAANPRDGQRLVDLSRSTMSVRYRELEAFDYGDPRDAWLADAGRGLSISFVGLRPERRLWPESLYGGLFLKNGVPIGYHLASALFGSSEVAYNVFPEFRGGESAWMFGRLLATVHGFLGATDFTVFRYQIGYENQEAIDSGAFWFYQKLGFRPRGGAVRKLIRAEQARMRASPGHRSPPTVLRRLSEEHVYFHLGARREDLIGLFPYANLGHKVTKWFASHGGSTAAARRDAVREAVALLGVRHRSSWPVAERRAFETWAPVVVLLDGLKRWRTARRRELVSVLRAKGGIHEVRFVQLSNHHQPFRRALQRLCVS
ncbi:MAG: hypothetical protein AMS18_01580 [Gemmatimonas sp. SG8_17]|nr:MAG: hypothetical protein AMS18_01580 [Gemmatimonas sp. SG8_17]